MISARRPHQTHHQERENSEEGFDREMEERPLCYVSTECHAFPAASIMPRRRVIGDGRVISNRKRQNRCAAHLAEAHLHPAFPPKIRCRTARKQVTVYI